MYTLAMDFAHICDELGKSQIGVIIRVVINFIKIGIPIILVILGMLDMGKAVMSQKEDEIKNAQSLFIKRIMYAVLVFLVVYIVQFVVGLIPTSNGLDDLICIKVLTGTAD